LVWRKTFDRSAARSCIEAEDFELAHYGRFTQLVRSAKIQYTWVSQHTRGLESLVTLDLSPQGAATLVNLRHEGLPDDEMGHKHEFGWAHYLEQLASHAGVKS
jgi:uncharacterized protein YndB with AHSA1/START domain